jgi:hypothetical protein
LFEHRAEIGTFARIAMVVGLAVLIAVGVTYWQGDIGPYRVKIEAKVPPQTGKSWEPKVNKE